MIGRIRTTLLLAAAAVSVAACGFRPLYGDPAVTEGMRSIAIVTPQTRTGYLLREQLRDQLAMTGAIDKPRYRLTVAIQERRRPRGLNPDDTPTRYELRLDLTYTLAEAEGGKVILKGARPVFISSEAVVQPYASITAQQDSEERAATEAATIIRTEIAQVLAAK
jgi:LPS-assembly lipoprotein